MKTYNCKIKFIADYLQARFSEEAQKQLSSTGGRKPQEENDIKEKIMVEGFSYKDEKGYYVPCVHLKKSIDFGAKQVKRKPRGTFSALTKSILWIKPERIYLGKKKPDHLEASFVKRQDGNRTKIVHPAFNAGTQIEFQIENLDENEIDESSLKKIVEWAGKMYGIGGRHPEFGRFDVIELKIVK